MNGNFLRKWAALLFLAPGSLAAQAQTPSQGNADFLKYAEKLREASIPRLEWTGNPSPSLPSPSVSNRYPWKTGVVTTLFWIGHGASDKSEGNRGRTRSAWDPKWVENYGGYDNPDPEKRGNFGPVDFAPKLNPFYVALPYNDVDGQGNTKPEAKVVIPWFGQAFVEEGKSVCRDRWVAVRDSSAGRVCYAQWSDCGPFQTDHWQYVFGNEKPKPNVDKGAGLSVSPAVRAFLGLSVTDVVDWKFVEFKDVPKGPWALYGANNPFVQQGRDAEETRAAEPPPAAAPK